MPMQTGVAVPGGQQMMTAFLEAFMRLDRGKRKLDVDIKDMFNEACRVSAGEDLGVARWRVKRVEGRRRA